MSLPLFSDMVLHTTSEYFYVTSGTQTLSISRKTGCIQIVPAAESTSNPMKIYGILGIINFASSPQLVVIKDRVLVGSIEGQSIWRVSSTSILPFLEIPVSDFTQHEDDVKYKSLLESILSLPLFFSYSIDITNTYQRRSKWTSQQVAQAMYKRVDLRFWWNRFLLSSFLNPVPGSASVDQYSSFILPVMMGFIEIHHIRLGDQDVEWALFSRRHTRRAGARYVVRGIDSSGAVANFVETEQVVLIPNRQLVHSFVQIRGSIPVFWTQLVSLKYAPTIAIQSATVVNPEKPDKHLTHTQDADPAFIEHFTELGQIYGKNGPFVCISLINLKGSELKLANEYQAVVERTKIPGIEYHAFDFHKECPGTNFEAINRLLASIRPSMDKMGWFIADGASHGEGFQFKAGSIIRQQEGVLRVNCIDNLDRTNVAQSVFAKHVLMQQLQVLGLVGNPSNDIASYPSLQNQFRNTWADNADAISTQYAGTGALKTDYTRTGKRSIAGMLMDGYNSVLRYYLNNFHDGIKQDAYNLFLGVYKVTPRGKSPFAADKGREQTITLLFLLFGLLCVFGCTNIVTSKPLYAVGYWSVFLGSFVMGFKTFGKSLVNIPVLTNNGKKD